MTVRPLPVRERPNGVPFVDPLIADHGSTTFVSMTIPGLLRQAIGPVTRVALGFSGERKGLHLIHGPKISSGMTGAAFDDRRTAAALRLWLDSSAPRWSDSHMTAMSAS